MALCRYSRNKPCRRLACQVVYVPSANTKSECLNKTIDRELIEVSKLEMNEINSTKSIVSKQVIL